MSPDITINISMGGAGGADVPAGGQAATTSVRDQAPPPLPLEQLQVSAAQGAPEPKTPRELMRLAGDVRSEEGTEGSAPPPMAIDQLLSGSFGAVPTPMDFQAIQAETGPPAPQGLQELGAGAMSAPEPMSIEELGEYSQQPAPPGPARGERRRDK